MPVAGAAHAEGLSFAACARTKSVIACGVTMAIANAAVPTTAVTNNFA
jgi:hypothetical protein